MISIIIPVYNEEYILSQKGDYFKRLSLSAELIFVDGGSSDKTSQYAIRYGKFIKSSKGRAVQMNAGAKYAQNDILLFLHIDTFLDIQYLNIVEIYIREKEYLGGCFSQKIDKLGLIFKWIAWTGNVRARIFNVFYGDQGIFVRKDTFRQIKGFPNVPICEDILFSKALRKLGKVGIIPFPIYASARRWEQQGILKTFIINMRIVIGLKLGYNLEGLNGIYKDIRTGNNKIE